MHRYLITVKLPQNKFHDPKNKVTADCPVSGKLCTDVTGEHHTILDETDDTIDEVRETWSRHYHVTRIEEI